MDISRIPRAHRNDRGASDHISEEHYRTAPAHYQPGNQTNT